MPGLAADLERVQGELGEARGLLRDTQAACKLLMETVREKEAAAEALEAQAEAARSGFDALRQARDEAASAAAQLQAELGGTREEAHRAREAAAAWQARAAALQDEADGRELELARCDLRCKVLPRAGGGCSVVERLAAPLASGAEPTTCKRCRALPPGLNQQLQTCQYALPLPTLPHHRSWRMRCRRHRQPRGRRRLPRRPTGGAWRVQRAAWRAAWRRRRQRRRACGRSLPQQSRAR